MEKIVHISEGQCQSNENKDHEESIQELLIRLANEESESSAISNLDLSVSPTLSSPRCDNETDEDDDYKSKLSYSSRDIYYDKYCQCINCCNKRDVANLVDKFENQKVRMITELGRLKTDCNQLDAQSSLLSSEVTSFAKTSNARKVVLEALQDCAKFNDSGEASSGDFSKQRQNIGAGDFCLTTHSSSFWSGVKTLKKCRLALKKRLNKQTEASFNNEQLQLRPESPVEVVLREKHELEKQLSEANDSNLYMVEKVKHLENVVTALFGKQNQNVISHTSDTMNVDRIGTDLLENEFSTSPLQKLNLMKELFENNQQLIAIQEEKLLDQSNAILKYEAFICDLEEVLSIQTQNHRSEAESSANLPQRLAHLRDSVRQMFINSALSSRKQDSLQHSINSVNQENILLSKTVTSLNDNIQELSHLNDKLMMKFKFNHDDCERCTFSQNLLLKPNSGQVSPRSDSQKNRADNEKQLRLLYRNNKSFMPALPFPNLEENLSGCNQNEDVNNGPGSAFYHCICKLKLVTKCLGDLKETLPQLEDCPVYGDSEFQCPPNRHNKESQTNL